MSTDNGCRQEIKVQWPRHNHVVAEHGDSYVRAAFDSATGHMHVTDLFVPASERRRGIASALVGVMHDVLVAEGGTHISGDISSRPCADVMRRVLGEGAVHSVIEAEYADDDPEYVPPAVARIDYHVPAALRDDEIARSQSATPTVFAGG